MKKILILNGSFCELPLIQEAKRLGYYVITTGNMPHLIGHKYADEYICADYSNKEAILDLVKTHKIDKIISCANDFGVLTAAYVSEKMGWPGHDSYEIAKLLHHKDKFKKFAYENNLPSPKSISFKSKTDAINAVKSVKYPIIVKANDLTGGKGIMKAEDNDSAIYAIEYAFDRSRDKSIVIEPFIEGAQQSFVAFLYKKKVLTYVSNDSFSPINPYLIQTETLPANGICDVKDELKSNMEMVAEKLKLSDGIMAFQYIRKDGKPYIIETMRRPFGNQFLTLAELVSGFPWHQAQIIAETGGDCGTLKIQSPRMKFCGHHGIMANQNGILKNYNIPQSIKEHVFKTIEIIHPGESIQDYLNERVAYIYYEYDNKAEMDEAVKHFNIDIKLEIQN